MRRGGDSSARDPYCTARRISYGGEAGIRTAGRVLLTVQTAVHGRHFTRRVLFFTFAVRLSLACGTSRPVRKVFARSMVQR